MPTTWVDAHNLGRCPQQLWLPCVAGSNKRLLSQGKRLWITEYGEESYQPPGVRVSEHTSSAFDWSAAKQHVSRSKYNLTEAAARQQVFLYQASLSWGALPRHVILPVFGGASRIGSSVAAAHMPVLLHLVGRNPFLAVEMSNAFL